MGTATIEYKCRRCDEIDRGGTGSDRKMLHWLIDILINRKQPPGIPADIYGIHHCKDGGLGVTDLIGARPDGPDSKL